MQRRIQSGWGLRLAGAGLAIAGLVGCSNSAGPTPAAQGDRVVGFQVHDSSTVYVLFQQPDGSLKHCRYKDRKPKYDGSASTFNDPPECGTLPAPN